MNMLNRSNDAILITFLTEWMSFNVSLTYLLPSPAVSFLCLRITAVLFIFTIHLLLMHLAVLSIRKVWTARIRTRSLRFVWHAYSHEKSPGGLYPPRLHLILLIIL